ALGVIGALALLLWFSGALTEASARFVGPQAIYGRVDLWSASMQGLAETRGIGVGLGGAEHTLEKHLSGMAIRKAPIWSHNDYVQLLLELGILGLLAIVAWLVGLLRFLLKSPICTMHWW